MDRDVTATTSASCIRCRAWPRDAVHRMEHRRADRRRAQWRESKARKRSMVGAYASLHDLGCRGPSHCSCRPIPVYA